MEDVGQRPGREDWRRRESGGNPVSSSIRRVEKEEGDEETHLSLPLVFNKLNVVIGFGLFGGEAKIRQRRFTSQAKEDRREKRRDETKKD